VAAAARVVGVPLIDHVVVTRSEHTSMLERGLLDYSGSAGDPPLARVGKRKSSSRAGGA
jgi:hypothetical protein